MKRDDFVHLHTHSDMSTLDGCGKINEYLEEALRRGAPGLAFTDHGTMRGAYHFVQDCMDRDVDFDKFKPIFGCEFYISKNMRRRGLTDAEKKDITSGLKKSDHRAAIADVESKLGIRDRWHMSVWALTNEGYRNLCRLSSAAWIDGFYYKPRIDLEELIKYSEGLAVGTGCVSSPITDLWMRGKKSESVEFIERLYEVFGDRLYLEIQPHTLSDGSQHTCNRLMMAYRRRWPELRLLVTQDAHYVHPEDWEHHEVLLCIGTNDKMSNPNRFQFDGKGFHMRTRAEMIEQLELEHSWMEERFRMEAVNTSLEFCERVTAKMEIDWHKCLLPPVDTPEMYRGDTYAWLKDLCKLGLEWRDVPGRAAKLAKRDGISVRDSVKRYTDRLKKELRAIKTQKFVGYFLVVRDLYEYARGKGIACGPGRGSAAGSIVAWLTGITSVDPIEHGLLFERFISPARIDMPDIDMDFEDVRREEIIAYLREKYGDDKVCQIATIGKLSGKQCLKDVSRVLDVPYAEVNAVTNSIIERSSGDERASQTIEDSFRDFQICRDFNAKYPEVLEHSRRLEGMAKNLGIHAAGVIASPVPLTDVVPLETRQHSHEHGPVKVTAFDMYGAAAMGLLKLDVLGLRTMTVLSDACKYVKKRHGIDVDLEALHLDDPKVLQGFTDHDYCGVFQYDTPGADKICAGVSFVRFEDVAAMTALNRPGTARSGLATEFIKRKKNPKLAEVTWFHPKVDEITQDTLGIIVYQEHVLRIFTEVAGFQPGTADSLRKKIAKKMGDEIIGKERKKFIEGAMATTPGMTEEVAGKIMDAITFFGSYGFNKSHATSYGIIAYWCMYMKVYHPVEFYASHLQHEPDRLEIQRIVKDARSHGIQVLPPDVSVSGAQFTVVDDSIRGSLCDIKNVGEKAALSVVDAQPFTDFIDFITRVERRKVNKRVVESLVRAGAMDGLVPNRKWFVENLDAIWPKIAKKTKAALGEVKCEIDASARLEQWSEEERIMESAQVSPLAFGKHPIEAWSEFLGDRLAITPVPMDAEDFWTRKSVWIAGVMVERKYNQVGDFHTGELPTEEERERQKWGARYANVNFEDASGTNNRVKVDWDIFDDVRPIVDSPMGTPVVLLATVNSKFQNMRAKMMVSLSALRAKYDSGEPLDVWEKIITGAHPALSYPFKSKALRAQAMTPYRTLLSRRKTAVTGVVTNLRTKKDKRSNTMAWFGLVGPGGDFVDIVVFGSTWPLFNKAIKVGELITVEVSRMKDGNFTLGDDGRVARHNKTGE